MHSLYSRPWLRYLLAIGIIAIAISAWMQLSAAVGSGVPYLVFYPAVMVAMLLGGLGPGLCAALLSTVFLLGFPALSAFEAANPSHWIGLTVFLLSCLAVCVLSELLGCARARYTGSEVEARSARALLDTLLQDAPVGFVYIDREFRFRFINERLAAIHGLSVEAHLGKRVHDIVPSLAATVEGVAAQILLTGLPMKNHEFHGEMDLSPGETRYWNESWYPVRDARGQIIGFGGVVEDITERRRAEDALRESERRLRFHVENTPLAVVEWGADFRATRWSAAAGRIFGWSAEEVIGKRWDDLRFVYEEDIPQVSRLVQGLADGSSIRSVSCNRNYRKDGTILECEWYNSSSFSESGIFQGALSLILDVTDRNRLERELRAATAHAEEAKRTAEEANEAKDQFLAVLSHELRTPLTPVLAAVQLMQRRSDLPSDLREFLEVIRRNTQLEARLIDDLLDLTRIARGKILIEKKPIDLRTVIERVVEICKPEVERRDLHLALDVRGEPYMVSGDASRLQQVIWNLLNNATKFTADSGCLLLRCFREEGSVVIEVRDSGVGIDPEVLPKLFNAFQQGDSRVTRRFGGLGLGLAISKRLVEMHGGTISAASAGRDRGASFQVRLPLLTGEHAAPNPSRPIDVPRRAASAGGRILLVEDNLDTASIMQRLIESAGYEVVTAADVEQALELARAQHFDLLLSDLGLPDRTGCDLMREIRGRGSSLKGIALSGFGREEDLRQSRDAGFSDHLIKPVDFETLVAAMERALSGTRAAA